MRILADHGTDQDLVRIQVLFIHDRLIAESGGSADIHFLCNRF
ncbi:MAG: hypothetical protein R3C14_20775 [Caldilineaceae bacterium]